MKKKEEERDGGIRGERTKEKKWTTEGTGDGGCRPTVLHTARVLPRGESPTRTWSIDPQKKLLLERVRTREHAETAHFLYYLDSFGADFRLRGWLSTPEATWWKLNRILYGTPKNLKGPFSCKCDYYYVLINCCIVLYIQTLTCIQKRTSNASTYTGPVLLIGDPKRLLSRSQKFEISKFQDFKTEDFEISRFQDFGISMFRDFEMSRFQSFKI